MNTRTRSAFEAAESAGEVSLFESEHSDLLSDCEEILEESERVDVKTQGLVERLVEVTQNLIDSGGDLKEMCGRIVSAGTYLEDATRDAENAGKDLQVLGQALRDVLGEVNEAAKNLVVILRDLVGEE
jgi:hypothetical protein